jgi:hypothetical protein
MMCDSLINGMGFPQKNVHSVLRNNWSRINGDTNEAIELLFEFELQQENAAMGVVEKTEIEMKKIASKLMKQKSLLLPRDYGMMAGGLSVGLEKSKSAKLSKQGKD